MASSIQRVLNSPRPIRILLAGMIVAGVIGAVLPAAWVPLPRASGVGYLAVCDSRVRQIFDVLIATGEAISPVSGPGALGWSTALLDRFPERVIEDILVDPFGHPFAIVRSEDGGAICAFGPDGILSAGGDDIVWRWRASNGEASLLLSGPEVADGHYHLWGHARVRLWAAAGSAWFVSALALAILTGALRSNMSAVGMLALCGPIAASIGILYCAAGPSWIERESFLFVGLRTGVILIAGLGGLFLAVLVLLAARVLKPEEKSVAQL